MTGGSAAADSVVVLSGRPPLLAGLVAASDDGALHPGPQEVLLRSDDGNTVAAAVEVPGVGSPPVAARGPLYLVVDRLTPPGRYRGEFLSGERRLPLDVTILEVVRMAVSPRTLKLRAAAGQPVEAEFSVSNDGNVPHDVPREVDIEYEEPDAIGRAMDVAVREASPAAGALDYLDRFVRAVRSSTYATSTATVDGSGATFPPGSQTLVRITTTIPPELAAGGSYHGSFTFTGVAVGFEIDVAPNVPATKRRPA